MPHYDFKNFPALLEKAGLNGSEVAPHFKVSRTTIYNWIGKPAEGKAATPPQQEVVRLFAERQIKVIEKAIAAGDLPLREVKSADRKVVLASVLRKHSQLSA